jgi:transposase
VLGTEAFSTTRAGYRALTRWLGAFVDVRLVGIEGTGSYGAGVTRHLAEAGIEVVEVDRPDRSDRRRRGKNDTLDAENAARAALAGRRTSTPRPRRQGEALRVLGLTRTTAVKSRRGALQLLGNQIVSAPEELRDQVRNLTHVADPHLRGLAARHQRVPRPGLRHPHRAQVPGLPHP